MRGAFKSSPATPRPLSSISTVKTSFSNFMRSQAEENARGEERRLQESGEEERRRIVTSAQQEIDTTANTARRELKSYAAKLAVDLAEKKIRVDQNKDEALVREFTSRLGKDGN